MGNGLADPQRLCQCGGRTFRDGNLGARTGDGVGDRALCPADGDYRALDHQFDGARRDRGGSRLFRELRRSARCEGGQSRRQDRLRQSRHARHAGRIELWLCRAGALDGALAGGQQGRSGSRDPFGRDRQPPRSSHGDNHICGRRRADPGRRAVQSRCRQSRTHVRARPAGAHEAAADAARPRHDHERQCRGRNHRTRSRAAAGPACLPSR